jgi:hypothetical protein
VTKESGIFASQCFAFSLATLYRPRLPHGWQPIVSVGSRTSDSVKASFGIGEDNVRVRTEQERKACFFMGAASTQRLHHNYGDLNSINGRAILSYRWWPLTAPNSS